MLLEVLVIFMILTNLFFIFLLINISSNKNVVLEEFKDYENYENYNDLNKKECYNCKEF
jgi:hypothetical protein